MRAGSDNRDRAADDRHPFLYSLPSPALVIVRTCAADTAPHWHLVQSNQQASLSCDDVIRSGIRPAGNQRLT